MIKCYNMQKRYGRHVIFDNMSLHLEKGDFAFLTGRSGAGKSTFIKLITAQEKIDGGELYVAGNNIKKIKSKNVQDYRRKIGIIFQDYQLIQSKTVFDNLKFVLEYLKYPRGKADKRIYEVLSWLGISYLVKKKVYTLSGGEQQRVAIARAIINEPFLLLADEPTGNLDRENAYLVMEILEEINKKGTTVLVATHDWDLIKMSNKKILEIKDKRISLYV